jgi:outer membrane protein OmpA-like peptidoglycan-associated protein
MRDRESTVSPENAAAPPAAVPAALARPQVAQVMALQRSAGNAAVAQYLSGSGGPAGGTLAREPAAAEAPPAGAAQNGAGGASQIAGLAKRVGSPTALRATLAANPGLAQEIVGYFAAGNEDKELNALMGQAFAPATAEGAGEPGASEEKNPVDPTVPLPAERKGDKKLDKGQMKWTLKPVDHSSARADVDFKPDATKVEAKNVSFGQTVLNQVGKLRAYAGGTATDPAKNKAKFEPFEESASKKRVDHIVDSENDPFYGAEWDQGAKKWKREGASVAVGSSKKGGAATSATMNDTPSLPWAREGLGDATIEFETVAVVLETAEPLGALKWGFKVKDAANAPIELTGAEDADATDAPSASWGATMEKYYEAKYAEILDNFDIGKSELKPDHKTKLDGVVTTLKAKTALKAQLGGAADLTGDPKVNEALSLKRAQAARDYLVSKGIDAARLEVQSYSSDWARVQAEPGKSEGKNRRVQVWLH